MLLGHWRIRVHSLMAGQRMTLSQATSATTAASTSLTFHVADEHLGSSSKVAMFKQGSEGTHGPRLAFLSDSGPYPLNDRTGLFAGWEAGADALASRAQETLTGDMRAVRAEPPVPARNDHSC